MAKQVSLERAQNRYFLTVLIGIEENTEKEVFYHGCMLKAIFLECFPCNSSLYVFM